MEYRESETVELKSIYSDDIKKEVIAMANSLGGTIYVGVDDDGGIVGVENADETIQRVSNAVRDSIKPDVTMFLHNETLVQDDKEIIAVRIQCGTHKPYYVASKGLRPEGVYVRQGTSSVPASETAIRQMIKETDGDNYEAMRSLEQSLTFDKAKETFAKRKLEFGKTQMKTLGIINTDELYTNLGLLLSDQCPHIIKAAAFSGTDQQNFRDRREFGGSLLNQTEEAYAYLDMCNATSATFDGILRVDHHDYPASAIREALLNAVVHRDYSFSASTLISVYSDRIELVSIGGLVHGISFDDIMMGLSVCRNQRLAEIFYRLQLIEAYGTGMQKIQSAYSDSIRKPNIQVTSGAFKIMLPNQNESADQTTPAAAIGKKEQVVLDLIRENKYTTRAEVEVKLNLKSATAIRLLKSMTKSGVIVSVDKGRNTKYAITAKKTEA